MAETWIEQNVHGHFHYEIAYKRLEGLLAGEFEEAWCGEMYQKLGAVAGAMGASE